MNKPITLHRKTSSPGVTIQILQETPDFSGKGLKLNDVSAFFDRDADALTEALKHTLPSPVLNKVLANLLEDNLRREAGFGGN